MSKGIKQKIFLSALVFGLAASGIFLGNSAEAKTVKKMVIKSINDDDKTIKTIKNGDEFTVNAATAKIRKGASSTKKMNFSTLEVGDVITVEGSYSDRNVTASKVRDLSYYDKKTVTFYGTIDSLTEAKNQIKITPLERKKQTITVLSSTKIKDKDGDKIKFSDLKEDDRVFVTGKWNRKKNTITKTKTIDVLDDDDYEDLDD